jgi:hypothetical protein
MASKDPVERQEIASAAGLKGWVNTLDRAARMAHVRENSPTCWKWHARKLGIDPEHATDEQRKRAESAQKLWYVQLRRKARVGQKAAKARRLREQADRLQAVADALAALDDEANAPPPQPPPPPPKPPKPPPRREPLPRAVHIPPAIRAGGSHGP